jgi:hypothetical protein
MDSGQAHRLEQQSILTDPITHSFQRGEVLLPLPQNLEVFPPIRHVHCGTTEECEETDVFVFPQFTALLSWIL